MNGLLVPIFEGISNTINQVFNPQASQITTQTAIISNTIKPEWVNGLVPEILYGLFGSNWSPQTAIENIESGRATIITKGVVETAFPIKSVLTTTGEGLGSLTGNILPLALIILAGIYLTKKK